MAGSSKYTYDDFLKALEESGFGNGGFSDADMKLAQENPDAGMSLISYKRDWQNATTDQARALANAGAERIRSEYGGYTGGVDGSQYYKNDPSPRDFSFDRAAPEYEAPGSFSFDRAAPEYVAPESFSYDKEAPEYTNRYDEKTQELLGAVLSRPEFSYDAETDPLYAQYRKQYLREGQRASEDVMGQAAAMSGGLPSSYAAAAAGQSRNYYNAQLTDKIPELEQRAYQKYLDADQLRRSDLSAVQNAEQADYQKYLNQLQQYNTDRNFAYGQYADDRNFGYQQYLDQLQQYNADRNFDYGQYMDELASQRQGRQDLWDRAQTAAEYGDYSGLQGLGVDTSGYLSPQEQWRQEMEYQRQRDTVNDQRYADEWEYQKGRDALEDQRYADETAYQRQRSAQEDALERAQTAAEYGDYSGLRGLGIDTSGYEAQEAARLTESEKRETASLLPLIEKAASRAEAFDAVYGATGDRLVAEDYAEEWERRNAPEKEESGYKSVYDTMNELGLETYEDAMAYLMSTGKSSADAMELANNYMGVRESGRYTGTGSAGGNGMRANQKGLVDPGQDAPDRERFLYAFTQSANGGTDPQTLADQLDVAVENGWITVEEAERLKIQAQANHAIFFGSGN